MFYEVGNKLIENKDELLNEFIDKRIHTYTSILNKLEGKSGKGIDERIEDSRLNISELEKLKTL